MARAEVKTLAEQKGLSTEEAGRMERYRIFDEMKRACGAQRIAVAHNQDDQAETVLHHLARGSGLAGLCGIRPVRGDVIRPLLFTERREIERLLQENGIAWRTDRTNLEQDYTRNKIRLSVLPLLTREVNGRAAAHIAQAGRRLLQAQEYLERVTEAAAGRCFTCAGDFAGQGFAARETESAAQNSVILLLTPFLQEDELIRRELVKEALARCGGLRDVAEVHIEALMRLSHLDCGKELSLPGQVRAVREDGMIRFEKTDAESSGCRAAGTVSGKSAANPASERPASAEYPLAVPGHCAAGHWEACVTLLENDGDLNSEIIKEKKYTKWLSYDTIKNDVLLRTRRPGDYLVVNEQGGRKKLKDYLIDCKVPKDRRNQVWLLADGSHILWVVGYRISEAAKVTKATKQVIKIQLKEKAYEGKSENFSAGAGSERADCRDSETNQ